MEVHFGYFCIIVKFCYKIVCCLLLTSILLLTFRTVIEISHFILTNMPNVSTHNLFISQIFACLVDFNAIGLAKNLKNRN